MGTSAIYKFGQWGLGLEGGVWSNPSKTGIPNLSDSSYYASNNISRAGTNHVSRLQFSSTPEYTCMSIHVYLYIYVACSLFEDFEEKNDCLVIKYDVTW